MPLNVVQRVPTTLQLIAELVTVAVPMRSEKRMPTSHAGGELISSQAEVRFEAPKAPKSDRQESLPREAIPARQCDENWEAGS